MNKTLQVKRDEMAETYCIKEKVVTSYQDSEEDGFKAGWDALHAELLKAAPEFNQNNAGLESLNQLDVAGDIGFIRGARWQHEQSSLQIAALREELSEYEGLHADAKKMYLDNREMKQQLAEQSALLVECLAEVNRAISKFAKIAMHSATLNALQAKLTKATGGPK